LRSGKNSKKVVPVVTSAQLLRSSQVCVHLSFRLVRSPWATRRGENLSLFSEGFPTRFVCENDSLLMNLLVYRTSLARKADLFSEKQPSFLLSPFNFRRQFQAKSSLLSVSERYALFHFAYRLFHKTKRSGAVTTLVVLCLL